jgi:hypothetical protein
MSKRAPLMQGVTAGWDSRVLLAASLNVSDRIDYFVNTYGTLGAEHPDVFVPLRLTKRLGLALTVDNTRPEAPDAFVEFLRDQITDARDLPKTRAIYTRLMRGDERLIINGNCSEICRRYFDPRGLIRSTDLPPERLAAAMRFPGNEFAVAELASWRSGLHAVDLGYELLDLLYWEQRMGIWGAQMPAEIDVASEQISPFNNRAALTSMLAVDCAHRTAPRYELYRRLIAALAPECLEDSVNPDVRPLWRRTAARVRNAARRVMSR